MNNGIETPNNKVINNASDSIPLIEKERYDNGEEFTKEPVEFTKEFTKEPVEFTKASRQIINLYQ